MEWIDYSEKYEVHISGLVRNKTTNRILKPYFAGKYLSVRFEMNGKKFYIHRLVAEIFLPQPTDPKCVVDHIDRNKLNNHADNLRWVSHTENMRNRGIETKPRKGALTKHHHITERKWKDVVVGYVVKVETHSITHTSYHKNLEDAIKKRNEILETPEDV